MKKSLLALAVAALFAVPAFAVSPEDSEQTSSDAGKAPVLTTKLSGFVMGEYNYNGQKNASPTNTFSLRMARMQVAGKILGDFDYRLQVQVSGTTTGIGGPHIVDAYVEWVKYKEFCVRVGEFKRAFTFENPMNPIDQGFYGYSTAVSKLAGMNDRVGEHPSNGRDLGIQFQGDLFPDAGGRPWVHYQIGLYNGQGINIKDVNSQKDLIGGLWVMPVKGMRIGFFGWDGRYQRGDVRVPRKRYAISGEYKTASDWQFRSEYVHSYGPAFNGAYGSGVTTFNEVLGDKADAWYAQVIAPVIKNVFHVKARYDVYRDNAAWDRCYTAYDFGCDYQFTKNLVISAIGSLVNDRRLEEHDYFMADLQISFRF
ncbi:MAG: porin [Bacteroidales bacterium]|nr:porin [Bacteroidales bacterium]